MIVKVNPEKIRLYSVPAGKNMLAWQVREARSGRRDQRDAI